MVKEINLKELLEKRFQRITLITEATTKKLVKKELRKLKRDIIKQLKVF